MESLDAKLMSNSLLKILNFVAKHKFYNCNCKCWEKLVWVSVRVCSTEQHYGRQYILWKWVNVKTLRNNTDTWNVHARINEEHVEVKQCLLSLDAESFVFKLSLKRNTMIQTHHGLFCLLFCMGVKLGLSHWGRNIGWGCSRIDCWVNGKRNE